MMYVIATAALIIIGGIAFWFGAGKQTLCTPCTAELVEAAKNGNPAAQAALMNISAGAYEPAGALGNVAAVVIMVGVIALVAWLLSQSEKKLPFLRQGQDAFKQFADQRFRGR
jgi:hypothetical protein